MDAQPGLGTARPRGARGIRHRAAVSGLAWTATRDRRLPRPAAFPKWQGGSASALSLSRPAQALLTLRPAGSLSRPKATFVTRLQPLQLPARAARQLPDQSTTLRVDSSSTDDSRLRGALPRPDSCTAANDVHGLQ